MLPHVVKGILKIFRILKWGSYSADSPVSESEVAQSCPTLYDPMDCSLPHSSIHGIFQARVLEWVAISFSRASSQPKDRNRVSHIVGRHFTVWATSPRGINQRRRQESQSVSEGCSVGKTSMATVDFEDGRGPSTKKFGDPVEAREKKKEWVLL